MAKPQPADASLYERDFHAWTQEQAAKLRVQESDAIDWRDVAEELADLGRREEREIEHRLSILLLNLLKWRVVASQRPRNWKLGIIEQRHRLRQRIKENPSLENYPAAVLAEEYDLARTKASVETGLSEATFPPRCPFTIDDILDPDFYPDGA